MSRNHRRLYNLVSHEIYIASDYNCVNVQRSLRKPSSVLITSNVVGLMVGASQAIELAAPARTNSVAEVQVFIITKLYSKSDKSERLVERTVSVESGELTEYSEEQRSYK